MRKHERKAQSKKKTRSRENVDEQISRIRFHRWVLWFKFKFCIVMQIYSEIKVNAKSIRHDIVQKIKQRSIIYLW